MLSEEETQEVIERMAGRFRDGMRAISSEQSRTADLVAVGLTIATILHGILQCLEDPKV